MASYKELCATYKKRQYDNVVDTVAAGLSHADEMVFDLGLLDGLGDVAEVLEQISVALPFVLIAATEGTKVVMGKKAGAKGLKDASFRAAKSGIAIAAGAGMATLAGGFAAVPTAISVRLLMDRYRSKATLGRRLDDRIETLSFLKEKWKKANSPTAFVSENPMLTPVVTLV